MYIKPLVLALPALGVAASAAASPYSDAVLADNPVSYFQFEGDATDSGTGNNDGTASGSGITFATTGGFTDGAGNGTGGYVSDNNGTISLGAANAGSSLIADLNGASAVTMEGFIDFDSVSSNGAAIGYSGSANFLQLRFSPDFIAAAGRSDVTDGFQETGFFNGAELLNGKRHFAAVLDYANDEIRLYIDGNEVRSESKTFNSSTLDLPLNGNPILLGGGQNGNFAGDFDEFAFYDKALTQEQIQNHFNAVIPEPGSLALASLGGLLVLRRRR